MAGSEISRLSQKRNEPGPHSTLMHDLKFAFRQLLKNPGFTAIVGETGPTDQIDLMRVSPEFFTTLGVGPVMGRAFADEEMTYQTDGVAILTDTCWRQRFNADPNILGRPIRVDGFPKTVVGVLPPSFRFLSSKAQL